MGLESVKRCQMKTFVVAFGSFVAEVPWLNTNFRMKAELRTVARSK